MEESHQDIATQEFVEAYLTTEENSRYSYSFQAEPCPFLGEDDHCTIYEVRPQSCREYPHTDKEGSQPGRCYMPIMLSLAPLCSGSSKR